MESLIFKFGFGSSMPVKKAAVKKTAAVKRVAAKKVPTKSPVAAQVEATHRNSAHSGATLYHLCVGRLFPAYRGGYQ